MYAHSDNTHSVRLTQSIQMDWNHIPTFFLIALIVEVSPGPNFLLITKTVVSDGYMSAVANITGFSTAFILHGSLSIFGISVFLTSSSILFFTVKLLGASYLCFLGIRTLRETMSTNLTTTTYPYYSQLTASQLPVGTQSHIRSWREGFITNCLNPKISIFYLAVFPQFIDAESYARAKTYVFVLIHIMVNAIWFLIVVLLITRLLQAARSDKLERYTKLYSGIALFSFGAYFAVTATKQLYT